MLMQPKKYDRILVIHESIQSSVLKDVFMMSSLLVAAYINHRYLGGNSGVYVVFAFLIFITIIASRFRIDPDSHVYSKDQLRAYVDRNCR